MSGAPSSTSTTRLDSSARARAWRLPAARATAPVSVGTTIANAASTTTSTTPAAGSISAAARPARQINTTAAMGGRSPRRNSSCSWSTSAVNLLIRSAARRRGRPAGTSGISRPTKLARRRARAPSASSCEVRRSRYRMIARATEKARTSTMATPSARIGGRSAARLIRYPEVPSSAAPSATVATLVPSAASGNQTPTRACRTAEANARVVWLMPLPPPARRSGRGPGRSARHGRPHARARAGA